MHIGVSAFRQACRGEVYAGKASLMKYLSYASACMLTPLAAFDILGWWRERNKLAGVAREEAATDGITRVSFKPSEAKVTRILPAKDKKYANRIWDLEEDDNADSGA